MHINVNVVSLDAGAGGSIIGCAATLERNGQVIFAPRQESARQGCCCLLQVDLEAGATL
jgi:hypothetical protein